MKRLVTTPALLALILASGGLHAAEQDSKPKDLPKGEEASIPFVNMGTSIREWQADGEDGLWVQDARRNWYYAKMLARCSGLDFAMRIGFQTRGSNTLDKFGTVIVPGRDRCAIQSFTKSEPPPKKGKRHKGDEGSDEKAASGEAK